MSPEEASSRHGAGTDDERDNEVHQEIDDDTDDTTEDEAEGEDEQEEEDEEDEDVDVTFDKFILNIKEDEVTDSKGNRLALDTQAGVDAFIESHRKILSKQNTKKQNLLHLIAGQAGKKDWYKKTRKLVKALIATPWPEGDLLAQQDDDEKTPLYCAIATKDQKLAKAMCEAHPRIDSVIRISSKRTNSLQKALQMRIATNAELIIMMIEKSSPDTLCMPDDKGLPPLHLAVDYARSDDTQLNIVKSIVEGSPQAMDLTYDHKGLGLLSAYRYHELTYQEGMEKAAREAKKKLMERKDGGSLANGQQNSRNLKELAQLGIKPHQPSMEQGGSGSLPGSRSQVQSEPTGKGMAGSMGSKTSAADAAAKFGLVKTKSTTRLDAKHETKDAPQTNGKVSSKKAKKSSGVKKVSGSKVAEIVPTEESAKKVKKYLKLYCLRTRNHDDAVEFLYGVQQDRQIYFDLFGCSPSLSEKRLQDSLKHLEFEDILQYVAIPQVKIEGKQGAVKGNTRAAKADAKGRSDLKLVFDWLKDDKQKKVKTILKVIVDDLQEPAHHDEAIEECLEGTGVEIWDWRKLDISPEVIKKVAPDVREVHLYWSGANAVLRGWSEPEGLRQLKKLEKIHLHPFQGLETSKRTFQYTLAFEQRVKGASERAENPIKVTVDGTRGSPGESTSITANEVNDPYMRHEWLTTMENFADFLLAAERNADPPYKLPRPVLVAVIDDGVDINEASVQSRVISGRSFCHRDEDQNLNQPYYVSSGGHGTAMAGLICKLCPNVQLFVLKLDNRLDASGGRTITAKSAAKAVRAAIDKGVDIISMSWTIERTELNKADIIDLESAVELAAKRDILMFCAATDQGAYRDRTYPAASGTKKIFKIGAAEATGAAYKWVGDQSAVDFIMPGHQVVLERHDDRSVAKFTPLTGSSVATALASGLAAVILYCVMLGGVVKADGNPKVEAQELERYAALKKHERMKEAFSRIGLDKDSEHKYVLVWNRFGLKKSNTLKKAEKETKDRWILLMRELADDLMREE